MATPQQAPDPGSDPRPVAVQNRLYGVDGGGHSGVLRKVGLSRLPDKAWAPAAAAALTLIAGLLALVTGRPLLFPSLGPTAFLQAYEVRAKDSSLYNVVAGQGLGLVVGYLMAVIFSLPSTRTLLSVERLTQARMWACVLAVGVTLLLQLVLHAYHPPAAATTLLVTLGVFGLTWGDALSLVAGIVAVALAGEGLRLLRLKALNESSGWAGPALR